MDGNPWKAIIFPHFFGTTIHLPTIAPGYQDFDTAISRHASYLALVMDSLGDFSRESKMPWENGAVLFPIFHPPKVYPNRSSPSYRCFSPSDIIVSIRISHNLR
jgi:hypothetical protein